MAACSMDQWTTRFIVPGVSGKIAERADSDGPRWRSYMLMQMSEERSPAAFEHPSTCRQTLAS